MTEAVYNSNLPLLVINHEGKLSSIKEEYTTEELSDFIFNKCHAEKNWTVENFINDQIELIRKQVGDKEVLLALSGGVDSSVVAALLIKAIGKKLHCVHVNHGLMRMGDRSSTVTMRRSAARCSNAISSVYSWRARRIPASVAGGIVRARTRLTLWPRTN